MHAYSKSKNQRNFLADIVSYTGFPRADSPSQGLDRFPLASERTVPHRNTFSRRIIESSWLGQLKWEHTIQIGLVFLYLNCKESGEKSLWL